MDTKTVRLVSHGNKTEKLFLWLYEAEGKIHNKDLSTQNTKYVATIEVTGKEVHVFHCKDTLIVVHRLPSYPEEVS